MPYLTQCYKRTKNTCHRTRHQHDRDFKFWNVKHREAIEHNDGVAAHEGKICAIISKNHTKLGLDCYISISSFVKNKIRFIHKTRIELHLCFNTTIGLNLEVICAGKHCNITHTALEALMYTGGISERTTSCYMLPRVNPFRFWAAVKQV